MVQTHKFLNIPNHEHVSNAVYDYVVNHTEILQKPVFWNWLDPEQVLTHVPDMARWFESKGVKPVLMALIYIEYTASDLTHIDVDPSFRVLWPIRNCAGSHTIFYNIDRKYFRRIHDHGAIYWELIKPDAPRKTMDFVELTQPVVFNPTLPHNIVLTQKLHGPRLSLTIGFDPQDPHSVNMDVW
jgi:hypothetical protein